MNREEIYDHLAQVYLGQVKEPVKKKNKQFNTWLLINVVITCIIFASVFYGLTAFLTQHASTMRSNVMYSLQNGSVRLDYNFSDDFPPVKTFSLSVPEVDASGYLNLAFSLRTRVEGNPGLLKVVIRNKRNEISSVYVKDMGTEWQKYALPLHDFKEITDWSCLTEVSFVLESWNVFDKRGSIIIEDMNFSGYRSKKT
jgi:hypothetical protein